MPRRVLALEPYYGGSHRTFLDQWRDRSRHCFEVLDLPAHSWKWRMRHAAFQFARQLRESAVEAEIVFCSDMLNLAEFRGFLAASSSTAHLARLPTVAYFHENQLTYPSRRDDPRDYHFGFTNLTTAWCADEVWFNSRFHRDDFLTAASAFLKRTPSRVTDLVEDLEDRCRVVYPGVDPELFKRRRPTPVAVGEPLRIGWAARWEHDKGFDTFLQALQSLPDSLHYELTVLGESYREIPPAFDEARSRLGDRIKVWGYKESRREYARALGACDVFVSTARHEFFGLAAVEAMAMGVLPVLPDRLSYPELLASPELDGERALVSYEGSVQALARSLVACAELKRSEPARLASIAERVRLAASRFSWDKSMNRLDEGIARLAREPRLLE